MGGRVGAGVGAGAGVVTGAVAGARAAGPGMMPLVGADSPLDRGVAQL